MEKVIWVALATLTPDIAVRAMPSWASTALTGQAGVAVAGVMNPLPVTVTL
jgi:hypothetical protein